VEFSALIRKSAYVCGYHPLFVELAGLDLIGVGVLWGVLPERVSNSTQC
jgi:hypothetical protein